MSAYNLDVAKTWALVDALLQTGRVEYIFVDRKIQRLLHRYALDHGWDEAYLDRLFYNVGRATRMESSGMRAATATTCMCAFMRPGPPWRERFATWIPTGPP